MWAELVYSTDVYPLLYGLWGGVLAYWVLFAVLGARTILRCRPSRSRANAWRRVPAALAEAFVQRGTWRDRAAGAMHVGLLVGWLLLLAGFVVTHYAAPRGEPWEKSRVIHALMDGAAVLMLVGLIIGGVRRARGRTPASRLDVGLWALLMVAVLAGMSAQGLVVALAKPPWRKAAPVSAALGTLLAGLPEGTLRSAYGAVWSLLHATLLSMAVLFPLTKWRHMILAPLSLLTRPQPPLARLSPLELEGPGPYGALHPDDLTRKQRLDALACTRCGRCSAACPATDAGRALDPLDVVQTLGDASASAPLAVQVGESALWDCTTCMACVEVCPVGISPLGMIMDLRRERVLDAAEIPRGAAQVFRSLERHGSPWPLMPGTTDDCLPVVGRGAHCEVLVWLGCMGRQDARAQRAARALADVLRHAGVQAATLGERETCCGDPARRLGNEYLWREQALAVRGTLAEVECDAIVTLCPHCAHMLGNEYTDLAETDAPRSIAPVQHATAYLAGLLREGRLAFPPVRADAADTPRVVTYHDPCYLARGVGDERSAREILTHLPGIVLRELPRHGAASRCCGAGGGRMWLEDDGGRLEAGRVAEVAACGAGACVTACPYCAAMLGDGLQAAAEGTDILDVVELVVRGLEASRLTDGARAGDAP